LSVATTYGGYSADWWTPKIWRDWVTATLGDGWFDPCPSDWTSDDLSGLDTEWQRNVYCNHPGGRGSAVQWWAKYQSEQRRYKGAQLLVWCAFSVEQLRHMDPSPFHLPGWLVMPRERTAFIWGGATTAARTHGKPAKSPANWSVWWTNAAPATPPVDCVIVRTA